MKRKRHGNGPEEDAERQRWKWKWLRRNIEYRDPIRNPLVGERKLSLQVTRNASLKRGIYLSQRSQRSPRRTVFVPVEKDDRPLFFPDY
jgi:hypothetical protein